MNGHAFGRAAGVIDLGSGHFLRPIHELLRRDEPVGTPIRPRPESPVTGFMLWHDCATEPDSSWRPVFVTDSPANVIVCGICGDRGSVVNWEWVKA